MASLFFAAGPLQVHHNGSLSSFNGNLHPQNCQGRELCFITYVGWHVASNHKEHVGQVLSYVAEITALSCCTRLLKRSKHKHSAHKLSNAHLSCMRLRQQNYAIKCWK